MGKHMIKGHGSQKRSNGPYKGHIKKPEKSSRQWTLGQRKSALWHYLPPDHRSVIRHFPDEAPGMPDPRTNKRHPEIGLHTPEGHQDQGTGFRLLFGTHLGLPSGSQPGKRAPFYTETWPEHLLTSRQCTKSTPINPKDLKGLGNKP
ncbi:hypothetical protein CRG98_005132 [Punica granatum]|uniref:Uncharacterized protein n=1 Tax=Punica granatum TaxID=22663 RepID=A0A2I0L1H2_PUNGR|nr:hypothetical protein CRG98_005132 [Punica granatum]